MRKKSLKKVLEGLDFSPSKKDIGYLKGETKNLILELKEIIAKKNIRADVFIGGSFAKSTLISADKYDIDVFIRFDWKYEDLSSILEKIIRDIKFNFNVVKLHGSRDYFRLEKNKVIFEIIPVVKIKRPREARNVTDLSYFHVNYVKRNLGKNLDSEIKLAKKFCRAQRVYGAESYIRGFSGYALECLIIYFKSFEKMIKKLIKVKKGERIVIDPKKLYKNKKDIFFELNESKTNSPVILIDPTWKERNALAGLSGESFERFQDVCRRLIKNPSERFFEIKEIDKEKLRKEAKDKRAEFAHIEIETYRQEGDIAGTKLKKFSELLGSEIADYFNVLKKEFDYDGEKADIYLIVKPKKEIIKIGPPLSMKENVRRFKKKNKKIFEKNGILHSREKIDFSLKGFIERWAKKNARKMKEMSIEKLSFP